MEDFTSKHPLFEELRLWKLEAEYANRGRYFKYGGIDDPLFTGDVTQPNSEPKHRPQKGGFV